MSFATGRHAYDEPLGTQPRVLHGARWALNALPGWTQVGISRVRGIAAARSCKASPQRRAPQQSMVFLPSFLVVRALSFKRALRPSRVVVSAALPTRPQVRRDYPLSLSISISGGKETYKDSPVTASEPGTAQLENRAPSRASPNCSLEKRPQRRTGPKSPGRGRRRG